MLITCVNSYQNMIKMNKLLLGLLTICVFMLAACGGGSNDSSNEGNDGPLIGDYENKVISHALSDPRQLTPLNASDNTATTVFRQVFQTLVHIDFKTYEIIPVLAKARPTITELDGGKVKLDFEIREEAKWDNGTPITGKDVDFTLRVLKNPQTDCKALKPYFDKIEDISIDKENPRKFSVLYSEPYMVAESAFADLYILPAYIYDPEGIMQKFTVNELFKNEMKLFDNADINKYAKQFNDTKFQREVVVGSGPYSFDKWQSNQRVILKRKKDWWGYNVKNANHWFEASPDEIVFETVNDLTTATVALKGESLDAMFSIEPKTFVTDLRKSKDFKSKFKTYTPPRFSYDYMGINQRLDKFSDVRTRRALAHVMNVDQLIQSSCYGLGERVASFTHPSLTERLNPNVKPYAHDHSKARALLAEAGWKDTDGDGTLDKEIDGEKVDFTITINTNNGNPIRKKACLIFQEECRKIGIDVDIQLLEWSVLLDRIKAQNFEMIVMGWISSPFESDPKQIWHTDSQNDGGSNYAGFGDEKSDAIIEDLRKEMDEQTRFAKYKELHQLIHDDVPYIFLLAQKERIAIHKKYGNAYASGIRPGYWVSGFQVATPTPN